MPEKRRQRPEGLKISRLAQLAGVPIPTIKHYLNEGLLPRPTKTGRTMSYYDAACVEKVQLIKRLQTERFFPLSVIKRIMESGAVAEEELALGEALLDIPAAPMSEGTVSRKEIVRRTGYSLRKVDRMESLGLVSPRRTSHGKTYDAADCQVIALVRQREDAGLPFDYSLRMMSIYRRHIRKIVRDDAKLFLRQMLPITSPARAAQYIREGDRALGAFMPLMKAKLVRAHAEKLMDLLNQAPARITEILHFRTLPRVTPAGKRNVRISDFEEGFRRVFSAAARKRGNFPRVEPVLRSLGHALRCLSQGSTKNAAGFLKKASRAKRLRSLAAVLEALAQYAIVSDMPGVFSPVHSTMEILSALQFNAEPPEDSDIGFITSYIRGAALAIVPDSFDTHEEAAAELKALVNHQPKSVGAADAWSRVAEEVKLKAMYFLARMYLDDEDPDAAFQPLTLLHESGGRTYYGRWASHMLKRLYERK